MPDHVHMLISIPPKLAVLSVVGYLKGKSAIHLARHCLKRERNAKQHLWARGYFVDTVGHWSAGTILGTARWSCLMWCRSPARRATSSGGRCWNDHSD